MSNDTLVRSFFIVNNSFPDVKTPTTEEERTAITNSKSIDISNCLSTLLPKRSVELLTSCETFLGVHNRIQTITSFSSLLNLRVIYLSYNCVSFIPDLTKLTKLTQLHLSHNCLNDFPSLLPESLQTLDLSWNTISEIPIEASKLENLEKLNLWHNSLTKITPEIAKLEKLKTFWIDSNFLTQLPHDITRMTTIIDFQANVNNFDPKINEEIDKGDLKSIFNAINENYKRTQCAKSSFAKIILLGESFTGKSSIFNGIIDQKKAPRKSAKTKKPNATKETPKPNPKARSEPIDSPPVFTNGTMTLKGRNKLSLQVWDTSGNVSVRSGNAFLLHNNPNVLYILTYNISDPLGGNLRYWLDTIHEISNGEAKPLVFATYMHGDLKVTDRMRERCADFIKKEYGDDFDNYVLAVVPVDLSVDAERSIVFDGDKVKQIVLTHLLKQSFMSSIVPLTALKLAQEVLSFRESSVALQPFMSWKDFVHFSHEHGVIVSEYDLHYHCVSLNDWGILIYFPKETLPPLDVQTTQTETKEEKPNAEDTLKPSNKQSEFLNEFWRDCLNDCVVIRPSFVATEIYSVIKSLEEDKTPNQPLDVSFSNADVVLRQMFQTLIGPNEKEK